MRGCLRAVVGPAPQARLTTRAAGCAFRAPGERWLAAIALTWPVAPEDDAPLSLYRAKRSADGTPEPFGSVEEPGVAESGDFRRPRLFVVQKHRARRLHWDFRLEWGGVLLSWAVPQGPSPDPAEKRLAVHVEDHPVEYADFEGLIPKDNYGAGAVVVWDRGVWIPLEEPEQGLRKGKLLFELRGYKLRGEWTLVRTKSRDRPASKEWLLIKHADAWSGPESQRAFAQESVYSGLTVEELETGADRAAAVRAALEQAGAPRGAPRAEDVKLMLAENGEVPFSSPDWLFELKYDGFRLLAERRDEGARLIYRRGSESSATYPDLARALRALPCRRFLFDGEVVVLEDDGRPSFARLQQRALLQRPADVARATLLHPATFYAFDLLAFEDFDLRPLPLEARKELLRQLLPRTGPLRFSDHVAEQGQALFDQVQRLGLEGVMAKRRDAPYRAGRSTLWLKLKIEHSGDFVVVGLSPPEGTRAGFGALHLAVWDGPRLLYAGKVGSGFGEQELLAARASLQADVRPTPPCQGGLPQERGSLWLEPRRVVEVRYKEWTRDGLLRQPVFVRFRDDKPPQECRREDLPGGHEPPPPPPTPTPTPETGVERRVDLTNLGKLFWPDEGYTKGDLVEYYRAVAPALLPLLRDRPVVLTRYPDGIAGKNFFQKDAPGFVPGWVRTERMWSEHARREIDYFVVDDLETLLYLANLGTIPLHVWSSRVASLAQPDWCVLDLDPKGAPFEQVVRLALELRTLCDEIGLPSFCKTSGSTGLHVLVPLGRQCTYEQSRQLGELLARVVVAAQPEIATITRALEGRGGRVYLDYLQNGHGRLLASAYSARPLPGAPVSTPLEWHEVGPDLDPRAFDIRSVPTRLARQARELLLPVLELRPDLGSALQRLGQRLAAG